LAATFAVVVVGEVGNEVLSGVHGPLGDAASANLKYVVAPNVAASGVHDTGTVPEPDEGVVAVTALGALGGVRDVPSSTGPLTV